MDFFNDLTLEWAFLQALFLTTLHTVVKGILVRARWCPKVFRPEISHIEVLLTVLSSTLNRFAVFLINIVGFFSTCFLSFSVNILSSFLFTGEGIWALSALSRFITLQNVLLDTPEIQITLLAGKPA